MVFNTSFLAFIQGLKIFSLKTRRDDDYCDRLSHHHTAMFLLITSILISSNQYVGNPIHCWVPKEFSDPWQKYANNYCWIKNTYVLPPNLEPGSIPKLQERGELEINYYQWVPIVLLCQSLLFYLPSIIWRMLNWTLGLFAISSSFDVLYKRGRDDDFVDRVNHWYTSIVLVLLAIFISAKQYLNDAITCWMPNEFSKPWMQYVENYCWIQNTYYIPHDFELPKVHGYRKDAQLSYYQWVPYVLAVQTFLFYFPRSFWRLMNWQSGINVQELVTKAMDVCTTIRPDVKKEESTESNDKTEEEKEPDVPNAIKDIAHHLELSIDSAKNSKSGMLKSICNLLCCGFGSRKYGFYLITLYLTTKLLYIVNVIGQLILLNSFIGTSYKFFGFQMLHELLKGNDWKNTGHFPRVTLCDFEIRNLGQRTNYTVQCVLPINLFNEKIYIFIWFWIFIVSILTVYSFFHWIFRMISMQRFKFIKGLLSKRLKTWSSADNSMLKDFIDNRLKNDGVFLIYLIYLNAGDLVTKELLDVLWFRHKKNPEKKIDDFNNDYTDDAQFL